MEEYELTETEFHLFRDFIYKKTGITLSEVKRHMVKSRLQKRLRHYGLTTFQQYYEMVTRQGDSSEELVTLINCITTNKTDFFREPHHFDYVAKELMPQLARQAAQGERVPRLKVWHAGCSTREEPYTLGITLLEAFAKYPQWDYRQLASDIDTNVLATAQRGIYDLERVETIPKPLLQRHFLRGTGEKQDMVRVKPELRERITFRQVNFNADVWPLQSGTQFDIIFCRNVVIYFDKPTQKKLFARFASLLKPGGWLFIGHSESLLGVSDAFESLGRTIYRLPETSGWRAKAA